MFGQGQRARDRETESQGAREPQGRTVEPDLSRALEGGPVSQSAQAVQQPILPGIPGSVSSNIERNVTSHMVPTVQGGGQIQPGVAVPVVGATGSGGLVQVDLNCQEEPENNSGPRRGTRLRQAPDKLSYRELRGP